MIGIKLFLLRQHRSAEKNDSRMYSDKPRKWLIRFILQSAIRLAIITNRLRIGDRNERDDIRGDPRYYIIIPTSTCAHPFECSCKAGIIFPLTVPHVLPVFRRIKSGITRPRRAVHRSNEYIAGYNSNFTQNNNFVAKYNITLILYNKKGDDFR